jgi:hypothetical protein
MGKYMLKSMVKKKHGHMKVQVLKKKFGHMKVQEKYRHILVSLNHFL